MRVRLKDESDKYGSTKSVFRKGFKKLFSRSDPTGCLGVLKACRSDMEKSCVTLNVRMPLSTRPNATLTSIAESPKQLGHHQSAAFLESSRRTNQGQLWTARDSHTYCGHHFSSKCGAHPCHGIGSVQYSAFRILTGIRCQSGIKCHTWQRERKSATGGTTQWRKQGAQDS